jgi:hypothetical protein
MIGGKKKESTGGEIKGLDQEIEIINLEIKEMMLQITFKIAEIKELQILKNTEKCRAEINGLSLPKETKGEIKTIEGKEIIIKDMTRTKTLKREIRRQGVRKNITEKKRREMKKEMIRGLTKGMIKEVMEGIQIQRKLK